jgi:hypothetical protein
MSHNYRDGGKGDKPRPFSVDLKKFEENFDLIFGKNKLADKIVKQTQEAIEKEKQNGNKTETSGKENND